MAIVEYDAVIPANNPVSSVSKGTHSAYKFFIIGLDVRRTAVFGAGLSYTSLEFITFLYRDNIATIHTLLPLPYW